MLTYNLSAFVVSVVLFGVFTSVSSLQCPSCSFVTVENVPGVVKTFVDNALGLFQDEQCKQELTGPVTGIKEETCEEESGKSTRCSWYKGVLTMTIPVVKTEISFHVNKRGCYSAAAAATPADGCHDLNDLNESQSALQDIIDSLTSVLNLHSFQGQRCIYSETYGGTSGAPNICVSLCLVIGSFLCNMLLKYS